MESVSLRKCPYDQRLTSKAYLSAVTVTNISRRFYLHDGGKNQLAYRYGTKLRHCRTMYRSVRLARIMPENSGVLRVSRIYGVVFEVRPE